MMISTIQPLLNAGAKGMNVNGSVTPKVYTYTASADEVVMGLVCLLNDEGVTSFGKFGAITALTNGVLIEATQAENTRTIANVKDNADMCTTFAVNQFGNGAVLSILSIVTPEGFGNTNNCFVGNLTFQNPIQLASGDTITVTVRDNLTNIDVFQMSAVVCKD